MSFRLADYQSIITRHDCSIEVTESKWIRHGATAAQICSVITLQASSWLWSRCRRSFGGPSIHNKKKSPILGDSVPTGYINWCLVCAAFPLLALSFHLLFQPQFQHTCRALLLSPHYSYCWAYYQNSNSPEGRSWRFQETCCASEKKKRQTNSCFSCTRK